MTEISTIFDAAFDAEIAKRDASLGWRAGGRGKEDEAWWRKEGPVMVQRWLDWRAINPDWELWWPDPKNPGIELDLAFDLAGVRVKGFVDRVFIDGNGSLVVVDIKTGTRVPDNPVQLALYAIGIEQVFGVRPQWGGYWMGRKGLIPALHNLDYFTNDMVGKWLTDFRKAVDNQIFLPHLTSMCKSCGVNTHCQAFQASGQSAFILGE
jgi:hypothetical protein